MTRFPWLTVAGVAVGGWALLSIVSRRSSSASPQGAADTGSGLGYVPAVASTVTLPEFLPLALMMDGHTVVVNVSEDYLPPMRGSQAQLVADQAGAMFPTRKMVDAIYDAAPIKLPFHAESADRSSAATIARHLAQIAVDRAGRQGVAMGQQKSYVVSNTWQPGRIVIYGGRYADGGLVQPLSGPVHADGYVDYSQGAELVKRQAWIDGAEVDLARALQDPATAGILSDEGVILDVRYS